MSFACLSIDDITRQDILQEHFARSLTLPNMADSIHPFNQPKRACLAPWMVFVPSCFFAAKDKINTPSCGLGSEISDFGFGHVIELLSHVLHCFPNGNFRCILSLPGHNVV